MDLIARAQIDRTAFEALYRRYVDPVYWYCLRELGDPAVAEDVTSDVFAKALTALPRWRARDTERGGSFRSWLFRIAHNAIVDAIRARRPHHGLDAAVELIDRAPTPEEAAMIGEDRLRLHRAMERLPESQRRVVGLRMTGLSGTEIATVLERNRPWVDTTYFRALTRLRSLLCAEDQSEEGA